MPLPLYLDINDVNSGIRKLIILLNDIPFVETLSSWEGGLEFYRRFEERYGARVILQERNGVWVFKKGYVTFQTDNKNPSYIKFLDSVGELVSRYLSLL